MVSLLSLLRQQSLSFIDYIYFNRGKVKLCMRHASKTERKKDNPGE